MQESSPTPITHITFSDQGGAGVIASRMVQWQKNHGFDSKLVTRTKSAIGLRTVLHPYLLLTSVFDFIIVRRSLKSPLFSVFRRSLTARHLRKANRGGVVHLHWTPGCVTTRQLDRVISSSEKTVWTLHDMWLFTGGCHHSMECLQFEQDCARCPQVRKTFENSVTRHHQRKVEVLQKHREKIDVVCPSKWLFLQATKSSALRGIRVHFIPNPVHHAFFQVESKVNTTDSDTELRVCFIANDLSDVNKNLSTVVQVVSDVNSELSDSASRVILITIGRNGPGSSRPDLVDLGELRTESEIANVLSNTDLLVSFSDVENAPNVISEAMACGIPVVARSVGGIPEMIQHGKTGSLVASREELSNVIKHLAREQSQLAVMKGACRQWAEDNYSDEVVMRRYHAIYVGQKANGSEA